MLHDNWKSKFEPAALGHGLELYAQGKAGEPELGCGGWQCMVDGQRTFVDDALDHASCTCGNGPLCKHVAAACFELEHQFEQAALAGFAPADASAPTAGPAASTPTAAPSPAAVLETLSDQDCRAFLARVVDEDDRWAGVFVRRFAPLEETALERDFTTGMKHVLSDYADEGFINWHNSLQCANALGRYVDDFLQPLAERNAYTSVLELANVFALALPSIAVDDSDGFFSDMLALCTDWWQRTFDCAPALRPREFEWMKSLVMGTIGADEDEADILQLVADNVEQFIERNFASDARFARDVEVVADKVMADEREKSSVHDSTHGAPNPGVNMNGKPSVRFVRWARIRIGCMHLLNEPAKAVERFALSLPPSLDILQPLVDAAVEAGDVAHAIELVRHAEQGGKTTDSALQLARLFDAQGRTDEALDEWFYLAAAGKPAGQKQLDVWFSQLKRHAADSWTAWERKLESSLATDKTRLRTFWKWEGRIDDIVRSLQDASRSACEPYRGLLLERSPQTYLDAAVREARSQLFGPAKSRSDYRRGINTLVQLRKIPKGEAEIARIVDELRTTYPDRTVLMEELDAVFGTREIENGKE